MLRSKITPLCAALFVAACTAEVSTEPVKEETPATETPTPEEPTEMTTSSDPAIAEIQTFIQGQNIDTNAPGWRTSLAKPPVASFADGTSYFWNLETTEGPIKVKLMPTVAPMHVSSTIYLTELGFYDSLKFHRVINSFMAQGGCPLGRGNGSPGYKYDGEFDKAVKHDRPGLLSMANAGPGTDGSQFFLTFVPTPHLDGKHTIFGEIVEGMDSLQKLEANGSPSGAPKKAMSIAKATITTE